MLKRIRIEGYESLSDPEVRLSPLTLLFGPNAAGKSNFLDALQLLSKLATSRTLKEAFDPPYRGNSSSSAGSNMGWAGAAGRNGDRGSGLIADIDSHPTLLLRSLPCRWR